jgi:hypothetical protein
MGESNNGLAEDRLRMMLEKRQQAIEALNRTAGQKPTAGQLYKQGDQVWLEATHLRFPHQKTKLLPKRYGPFKVVKEISPVAFRLELPASWNIHNVFHASLPCIPSIPVYRNNCAWTELLATTTGSDRRRRRIRSGATSGAPILRTEQSAPIPRQMEGLSRIGQHLGTG